MLKIDDVVALAKAGYKVADVKELIAMSKEAKEPEQGEQKEPEQVENDTDKSETHINGANLTPHDEPPKAATVAPVAAEGSDIDYKAKLAEVEKMLKEAQAANRKADNSGNVNNKTYEETFADIARCFM